MKENKCPCCQSERTVLYEPKLLNNRFWCLDCNSLYVLIVCNGKVEKIVFEEDHDAALRIIKRCDDEFDAAKLITEKKVCQWLAELVKSRSKTSVVPVAKKIFDYLNRDDCHTLIGHLEINFRTFYSAEVCVENSVWLDHLGIRLKRSYLEKDKDGQLSEEASFVLYPPANSRAARDINETLQQFATELRRAGKAPHLIEAYDYDVVDSDDMF